MKIFNCIDCVKIVCEKNIDEGIRLAVLDLQRNLHDLSKMGHEFSVVNEATHSSAIYIQTKQIGEAESYEICVDDEKVQGSSATSMKRWLP